MSARPAESERPYHRGVAARVSAIVSALVAWVTVAAALT